MRAACIALLLVSTPAMAVTNKPTLREALTVPGAAAVVGETDGTYTAYTAAELAKLPTYATPRPLTPAQLQAAKDAQQPTLADLRDQAQSGLDTNAAFLAIASPTNAQLAAQVRALTQQNVRLINAVVQIINLVQ